MYKRKFPKTKTVVDNENYSSQLKSFTNSSLSASTPLMSNKNNSNDIESPESPSMLEDFIDFPVEKKKKTVDEVDDTTDCSQPLFNDDDNDTNSYLRQTLISCGLHLKCDQNILCMSLNKYLLVLNLLNLYIILIAFIRR